MHINLIVNSGLVIGGIGNVVIRSLLGFSTLFPKLYMQTEFVQCVVLSHATRIFLQVLQFSSLIKNQHIVSYECEVSEDEGGNYLSKGPAVFYCYLPGLHPESVKKRQSL